MSAGKVTGGERVVANLRGIAAELPERVARVVTEFAIDVTATAKLKVSGDVLKVRTGRLRRSIHYEVNKQPGRVSGIVGTNVEYAAVHEHGFDGPQSVRSFMRMQTQAFGRSIVPRRVSVGAFTRHMTIKARPFLAPALASTSPSLADRLRSLKVQS